MDNYIQKMIDEYNARNTEDVIAEKSRLTDDIQNILADLENKSKPVFEEFPENPLLQKPNDVLMEEIKDFSRIANEDEKIVRPTQRLILELNNFLLYKSFCELENNMRNENVAFEDTYAYDFTLTELVDYVYEIKQLMKISTKDLLCYTYYYALKDFSVTLTLPLKLYAKNYKHKKHRIKKYKNDPAYQHYEAEKSFLLHDEFLSEMYKNFVYMYNNELIYSKVHKILN